MCFIHSGSSVKIKEREPVEIKQANASLTKSSQKNVSSGYFRNVRSNAFGLNSEIQNNETLLGE